LFNIDKDTLEHSLFNLTTMKALLAAGKKIVDIQDNKLHDDFTLDSLNDVK